MIPSVARATWWHAVLPPPPSTRAGRLPGGVRRLDGLQEPSAPPVGRVDLSRRRARDSRWRVQAADAAEALALLPAFIARRTVPIEFRDVQIP